MIQFKSHLKKHDVSYFFDLAPTVRARVGRKHAREQLAQLERQVFSAKVCVSLEVLQILVAGDGCDLHHIQPFLKQAASCLMPQVMKMQRTQPAFIADTAESVLHGGLG